MRIRAGNGAKLYQDKKERGTSSVRNVRCLDGREEQAFSARDRAFDCGGVLFEMGKQRMQPSLDSEGLAAGKGRLFVRGSDVAPFAEEVAMEIRRRDRHRAAVNELFFHGEEFLHDRARALRLIERISGNFNLEGQADLHGEVADSFLRRSEMRLNRFGGADANNLAHRKSPQPG